MIKNIKKLIEWYRRNQAWSTEFSNKHREKAQMLRAEHYQKHGKPCPRCDKKNINVVAPSLWKKGSRQLVLGPLAMINQPKTLYVCRDCGFSWEDR